MPSPPVVLSIAGSDSCAGAGIQADLKACRSLGVHCLTAVTAVVSETPAEVSRIEILPPEVLVDQVRLLLSSYPVSAIKTGMLGTGEHIHALADLLKESSIPLVIDPVMVATTGDSLAASDVCAAYQERLLPLGLVTTPNIPEAHELLGASSEANMTNEDLAMELTERFGMATLLTGGHATAKERGCDLLYSEGQMHRLEGEWIDCPSSHGTGCTFSAALAAGIASGLGLVDAAKQAKICVTEALRHHYFWTDPKELLALNPLSPCDKD